MLPVKVTVRAEGVVSKNSVIHSQMMAIFNITHE